MTERDDPADERVFGADLCAANDRLVAAVSALLPVLDRETTIGRAMKQRLFGGANDILAMSGLMLDAFAARTAEHVDRHGPRAAVIFAPAAVDESVGTTMLAVAITKSLFYFVRSYQDAIYGLGLQLCGQTEGHRSLADAISNAAKGKRASEAYEHLCGATVGYVEWFRRMRSLRNRIKHGRSAGMQVNTLVSPPQVAILLLEDDHRVDGDVDRNGVVGFGEAAEAIVMTAAITETATRWASGEHKRRRAQDPAAPL